MAYSYGQYIDELTDLMVVSETDPSFVTILPAIIDYAEQRIYRELNLLANTVANSTVPFVANNRNLTFGLHFTVCDQINVITPAGQTDPELGTRNPLTPCTREYLDLIWSSSAGAGLPTYFAMQSDQSIVVGPWPDAAYTVEVVGVARPLQLSATNITTYLTTYLPDLFLAASMVYASAYKQNFGASADDPKMAMSWEQQYQLLFASANAEEERKNWAAGGWTSQSTSKSATPPRA